MPLSRPFFLYLAMLRHPRCHSRNGAVSFFQGENYRLLRWPQFRPERQDFLHASQPIWEFRVQGHAFQLVTDPQPHQVVAHELWSGHALPHLSSVLGEGLFVGRT